MQEGKVLPARQINADLLKSVLNSPKWFWIAIAILSVFVLGAMAAAGLMFNKGLGITGLNRPVMCPHWRRHARNHRSRKNAGIAGKLQA